MSIVLNLQKNIISNRSGITDLLREALLIASKLKLNDFKTWINNELKGYSNIQEVPDYRIIFGEIKYFDPYEGWHSLQPDIVGLLNEFSVNKLYLEQSISEIEDLILKKDSEFLAFSIPEESSKILRKTLKANVKFSIYTHTSKLASILEHVKTVLLEWAIKLEEEGIIGDDNMSFSNEEKDKAQQSIHIENFNGVMGDIANLGNLSTGDHNQNISTISSSIDSKLNDIIKKISTLDIDDKNKIIQELEENKNDTGKLTKILGQLMTRGSEIATIAPAVGELLGMLG